MPSLQQKLTISFIKRLKSVILVILFGGSFITTGFAMENQALQVSLNPPQTTADKSSTTKPHLAYELKPGKSLEDVLTIHNYSGSQTYRFKIYAVDSIQSSDGASGFKLENKNQTGIGNWIVFNQKEFSLKPGETRVAPYSILIPEKTTPGTYQGGLVAELINEDQNEKNTGDIKISSRLIEPVYVSVPGRKKVEYNVDDFSYREIGSIPSFYLKFSNQGNVFLKTNSKLSIAGTLLEKPYELDLSDSTILQGEKMEKVFNFENPPLLGEYNAVLTMEISEYNVAKNEHKIISTVTKSITFNIIPYSCIEFFLIVVLFLITVELIRRKYFRSIQDTTFVHNVKKGETVLAIADLYQVDWKKIVKLNKLQKPYTLKTGQSLELPFPRTGAGKKKKKASRQYVF